MPTRPSSINPGSSVVGMPGATGLGAAGEVLPIAPPNWMSNPEIIASGLVFGPGTTFDQALAAARQRAAGETAAADRNRQTRLAQENALGGFTLNAPLEDTEKQAERAAFLSTFDFTTIPRWKAVAMFNGESFDGMPEGYKPGGTAAQEAVWANRRRANMEVVEGRPRIDWDASDPGFGLSSLTGYQAPGKIPDYQTRALQWYESHRPGTPGATHTSIAWGNGTPITPAQPTTTPDAAKNFLPPYLQPGANAGSPFGKSAVPTLTGAPTGNAVAPPITTPTPAPGSPIAPIKPPGSSGFTGGFTPNAPGAASPGGSFASTAKLLELPYYLRQQYGR